MADSKITALTAISTVDPTADPLVIVDVSDTSMAASGTTKKSTINQLLGSGGTATLASATITGDLTVDTNVLKVDTTNNRVGIGTASPGYPLHVSATDAEIVIQDSNTAVGSNPASLLSFWGSASRAGYIGYPSDNNLYITQVANSSILFLTNNTTQMTLNSTGLGVGVTPSAGKGALQLSSGINFPATQVASSDVNTLDDYEEGTFTPTVIGTTTAGTGTYSNQTGYYTKVGRLVTITVYMNWTAHTGTGNMRFAGLPFASANLAGNYNGISIAFLNNIALTAGNVLYGNIEFGTTQITLVQYPTGGGAYSLVPIDTSAEIAFTGTYFV